MSNVKKCTCGHEDFKLMLEISIPNTKITEEGNVTNMTTVGKPTPSRLICLNCNKEYSYSEFVKAKCECCGNLFNHSEMKGNLCDSCNKIVEMVKKSPIEIARQIINQKGSVKPRKEESKPVRKEENKVENTKKNEKPVQKKQEEKVEQKVEKVNKAPAKREEKVIKEETFSNVATVKKNETKTLDLTSSSVFSNDEEDILANSDMDECDFMEKVEEGEFNDIASDLFDESDDNFDFDNFDSYN